MNKERTLREMNFDSSLLESLDKTITRDEFKEQIISLTKPILQRRFKDEPIKQEIKPHTDRITISCPYCGDSMQNPYKKRGNIILDKKFKNYYKCFNCGIFKRIDYFLKDFNVDLELDVIKYVSENLGDFKTNESDSNVVNFLDLKSIEKYVIERKELKDKLNLIEINESPVFRWLKKRLQFNFERFLYDPLDNSLLILNLTSKDTILGAQRRIFKPKKGQSKYLTYNISKLYEFLRKSEEIPDSVDLLSQIFRIFEINLNLPVTLFEGPMDAFLYRNSIANTGANKTLPFPISVRYFYDDDKTGREKALENINNEKNVFLWSRFKKDIELPYRKKWDLNSVLIYLKEKNIRTPLFDNYFSNDPLDSIDI